MQKINIIIPMAGEGRRFKEAGFKKPKPLIKVFNKTLIEIAIETLDIKNANFYFVARKYKNNNFNIQLKKILLKYTDIKKIVYLKKNLQFLIYHFGINCIYFLIARTLQILQLDLNQLFEYFL